MKQRILAFEVFGVYRKLIRQLESFGVTDIHIHRFSQFHHGFFYFRGEYRGEPVFIKADTRLHFLSNEYKASSILSPILGNRLVPIVLDASSADNQILVFQDAGRESLDPDRLAASEALQEALMDTVSQIHQSGLIHRDIRYDNFLWDAGSLKVIDFTFATPYKPDAGWRLLHPARRKERRILQMLGSQWKPGLLEWNDFYSLRQMLLLAEPYSPPDLRAGLRNRIEKVTRHISAESTLNLAVEA